MYAVWHCKLITGPKDPLIGKGKPWVAHVSYINNKWERSFVQAIGDMTNSKGYYGKQGLVYYFFLPPVYMNFTNLSTISYLNDGLALLIKMV